MPACTSDRENKLPELPEIEHLKRSLEPLIRGAHVLKTRLQRSDIAHQPGWQSGQEIRRVSPGELLNGTYIDRLVRHGKQLAFMARNGKAICFHMGMSGQLRFLPRGTRLATSRHVHCVWSLRGPKGEGRLIFRDPRRFGGIWCFDSQEELIRTRWSSLGPDALNLQGSVLVKLLSNTRRSIKTTLLDQTVIAGVGNIYADECLFSAGIHPATPSHTLSRSRIMKLNRSLQRILSRACEKGGSTIRSYVDANGRSGSYADRHLVYGRAGLPCMRCERILLGMMLAQRTTVFCDSCQKK